MEISQHIKNLLKTNSRVILKNFGAFETKHISAVIDKETKVMKPPFKIVIFNSEVKEDAGLLQKYMAEQERISLDNASEQIDEYVKTIKSKLETGQPVDCKDLGTFKKTSEGTYEFSFLSEENLLLDSFGLPILSLNEKDKVVAAQNTGKVSENKVTPQKVKSVAEPVKKVSEIKPQPVKQQPVKQVPVKKPVNEGEPKKRKRWLAFVIPIVAIGAMLAAIYFFKPDYWKTGYEYSSVQFNIIKNKVVGLFNKDKENFEIIEKPEKNQITEVIEDTLSNETNNEVVENIDNADVVDDTEKEIEKETVDNKNETVVVNNNTIAPSTSGRYYIIIGSVESQSKAEQEKNRFAQKGIQTEIIHVPNMNRYRISAGAFNSAKEAQDYFSELQKKYTRIEGWVWEKK